MDFVKSLVGAPDAQTRKEVDPQFFLADGTIGPDHLVHATGIKLLGVGNPLLDISAKVPESMLAKYGVKSGDIILAEEQHAGIYDELVKDYAVEYIAGGATQNTMRVAAWMLTADKITGACAYTGCVGADSNAAKLKECAEAGGVTVFYQVDAETPTGVCAVLVDPSAERALVTRLDAANNFKKAHLETPEVQKFLVAAEIVYSAGFFLTSGGVECTSLLGEHCADYGKRFCLNISAPFIAMFFAEQLMATLPYTDILFANEMEAAALGEAQGWGTDVAVVALKVAALPKRSGLRPRTVVFTQGAESTIVVVGGVVTKYAVPALAKELIVDTNGAGDAFVGGFLAKLVQGNEMDACVKAGHFAARAVIQRSGATVPDTCNYGSIF
ncbi:Ribokinase-like protein [Pelagophyceae sp. CCMP2097]|nr:Ribokinase-like protein [Pelagophyceae sp. CCMP2097]|eukprot:CAMPEP_0184111126 /NCGR_PEP_ID=MMETSP0974-20121125/17751_1 /TAXON_ID=483370 /ORGANISM="non described non described, Strain CCMP2097" /LENGTH=384 /DNA_ID=CAMNT_0026414203 /DNA_START=26 /DNA_END=1180 /DNA_ORIENTATION=+